MVTLLSTVHSDKGTETPDPEKKLEVITYYNTTKGGIDNMDQMVKWFTSKKNWKMAHGNILQHAGHQRSKRFYYMDVPQ